MSEEESSDRDFFVQRHKSFDFADAYHRAYRPRCHTDPGRNPEQIQEIMKQLESAIKEKQRKLQEIRAAKVATTKGWEHYHNHEEVLRGGLQHYTLDRNIWERTWAVQY
mmetsp:Transcript_49544/g.72435  ORF Transcript_49544/g.72435 Transcript_49544/m.72435 type:complete len:109 (+) Transcript_49544:118-444(+)